MNRKPYIPVNPKAGIYDTVGHCKVEGCGVPMVSKHAWDAGVRKPGHASHGGKGMCRKHYARWTRHGSTERQVAVGGPGNQAAKRSREEVLEDYAMIKDDCTSVRHAAERMGMTFSALDKALYRARLDGDVRAMPPSDQVSRALGRGATYPSAA